jgi:hypothetical protein
MLLGKLANIGPSNSCLQASAGCVSIDEAGASALSRADTQQQWTVMEVVSCRHV